MRPPLPLFLAAAAAIPAVVAEGDEAVCAAGEACPPPRAGDGAPESPHFWPSARGHVGSYSTTHHVTPVNLSSGFSWKWYHPLSQYLVVALGVVIDKQRNVYLTGHSGILKLDEDGREVWNYSKAGMSIPIIPYLLEDSLVGGTHQGTIFSLDLETGRELWVTKVANSIAGDTAFVTAHDGIIIAPTDANEQGEKNSKVTAVRASDGSKLWSFEPVAPVWNFMALFPGDGTVVFQDLEGRAYRLDLKEGLLMWKNGGTPDTWSDGTLMLGPNGVVYAVTTLGPILKCSMMLLKTAFCGGSVVAYRLSDGQELWRRVFDRPANAFLAVGRVRGAEGLSVVAPIGQQAALPRFLFFLALSVLSALLAAPLALLLGLWQLRKGCSGHQRWQCMRSSCTGFMLVVCAALVLIALVLARPPVYTAAVFVLDAETGATRWQYELPEYRQWHTAGDPEGFGTRVAIGTRPLCLPNPFSAPTIGANGAIYFGYQDGRVYSVLDANADGSIDENSEVSTFSTGTAFSSPGAAFAPGMFAIANCDGVFAFKQ